MLAAHKHNASALFGYTQRYHAQTRGYLAQSSQTKGPEPWTSGPGSRASRLGYWGLYCWCFRNIGACFCWDTHLYSRTNFKLNRAAALAEWRQLLTRIDLGYASDLMRFFIKLTAPMSVLKEWLEKTKQ